MRKGEWSRSKVSGKTAIELGAGMGLGGLALAMLGGWLRNDLPAAVLCC